MDGTTIVARLYSVSEGQEGGGDGDTLHQDDEGVRLWE
jgi:hypothetical protein